MGSPPRDGDCSTHTPPPHLPRPLPCWLTFAWKVSFPPPPRPFATAISLYSLLFPQPQSERERESCYVICEKLGKSLHLVFSSFACSDLEAQRFKPQGAEVHWREREIPTQASHSSAIPKQAYTIRLYS